MCVSSGKALQGGNCQWYFFSHAAAPNRISPSGYWTPVGAKETVTSGGRAVGMKTTLVFYAGQAPDSIKTNWVMHEYQLIDGATSPNSISRSNGKSSSSMRRGSKKRRVSYGIYLILAIRGLIELAILMLELVMYCRISTWWSVECTRRASSMWRRMSFRAWTRCSYRWMIWKKSVCPSRMSCRSI